MTMDEICAQVKFNLGFPTTDNVEQQQVKYAVLEAFRELKRYMKTPTDKTVPFSTRIDLQKVGIHATKISTILPSQPRIGLTMSSIDSGNVFQVAAAVNVNSMIGNTAILNIDPIMAELSMAQVRNTITTDFQWSFDRLNQVVYCTHRDPKPATVTIRYVPDFKDVSEIKSYTYIDYLIRMSEAYMKKSLGRARSKYTIEGSNVRLDGDILLDEANQELENIREELNAKHTNFAILT